MYEVFLPSVFAAGAKIRGSECWVNDRLNPIACDDPQGRY